jgi:hypothetical protein
MISPLLAKLHGIILENKINVWLKRHGKRDKGHPKFSIIQLWTFLLHEGSLWMSVAITKPISYVVLLNLENILT